MRHAASIAAALKVMAILSYRATTLRNDVSLAKKHSTRRRSLQVIVNSSAQLGEIITGAGKDAIVEEDSAKTGVIKAKDGNDFCWRAPGRNLPGHCLLHALFSHSSGSISLSWDTCRLFLWKGKNKSRLRKFFRACCGWRFSSHFPTA